MTVSELIELLKEEPQDAHVIKDVEGDYVEASLSNAHEMHMMAGTDYYSSCAKEYQRVCGLCDKPKEWPKVTVVKI